jgi:hypothetical protein
MLNRPLPQRRWGGVRRHLLVVALQALVVAPQPTLGGGHSFRMVVMMKVVAMKVVRDRNSLQIQ